MATLGVFPWAYLIMSGAESNNVLGVIVTYNPNPLLLFEIIKLLNFQVWKLVVVDNCSDDTSFMQELNVFPNLILFENKKNMGLAYAYNQGVSVARKEDANFVLLMDQDSLPHENMVEQLLNSYSNYDQAKRFVAAAGPNYTDFKGNGGSAFLKFQLLGLKKIINCDRDIVEVDHLISSGSLIPVQMFNVDKVGPFIDELFIDYVDTEWCWRARRLGFTLFGVCSANMRHSLGDSTQKIFGKSIPIHSPFRHFYLMRNGFWLLKQSWVGWRWRLMDSVRLLKIFIYFSVISKNRMQHFKAMFRGIIVGLTYKKLPKIE